MAASTTTKRVHILTAVNAANVSKGVDARGFPAYTIKDVCGAVDGIVMNDMLYQGDQLAAGVATLNDRPAPAGHPKDSAGRFISASSGDALLTSFVGAVCRNARHEGGRTLTDIVVNEAQAKAHPDGVKLVERLEAALNGSNVEPIHVSTGLVCQPITANGESGGKKYSRIATDIRYDHLAILLNTPGAGTPEQGVGMFLNAAGAEEPVEAVVLGPHDNRSTGLSAIVNKLIFRRTAANELSYDQIRESMWRALQAMAGDRAWVREIYDRYAIWSDGDGKLWKQDYSVSSDDASVAFSGIAVEVRLQTTYEPVTNLERDPMKEQILAALNAAGIAVAGKTDDQLLADFKALQVQPVQAQLTAANAALTAANSKIAGFEAAAQAAADAEVAALATELAVNSSLTVDDLKKLGLPRLKELKTARKGAAPLITGNGAGGAATLADLFVNHREQHEAAAAGK